MMTGRVSVEFLCKTLWALRKANGNPNLVVPMEMMDRWIAALGQIEREYRELAAKVKHRKAQCE